MVRKLGFALIVVALVVNFFQPVVTVFPHRGAQWTAPWPMQVAQAGVQSAVFTYDDLQRWVAFAILGWLFGRFATNLEQTLEMINDTFDRNYAHDSALDSAGPDGK